AALKRVEVGLIEAERAPQGRGVPGEAFAVSLGGRIARFDRRTQAEDDRFRRFEIVRVPLQPDERANPRVELYRVERLADELVAPRLDPSQPLAAVHLRRDDDDRDQPCGEVLLQLTADADPAAAGRREVE